MTVVCTSTPPWSRERFSALLSIRDALPALPGPARGPFRDVSEQSGAAFRRLAFTWEERTGHRRPGDNDGLVDLVLVSQNEPLVYLHNRTPRPGVRRLSARGRLLPIATASAHDVMPESGDSPPGLVESCPSEADLTWPRAIEGFISDLGPKALVVGGHSSLALRSKRSMAKPSTEWRLHPPRGKFAGEAARGIARSELKWRGRGEGGRRGGGGGGGGRGGGGGEGGKRGKKREEGEGEGGRGGGGGGGGGKGEEGRGGGGGERGGEGGGEEGGGEGSPAGATVLSTRRDGSPGLSCAVVPAGRACPTTSRLESSKIESDPV